MNGALCPVPGCENTHADGHLMCRACWFSVSQPVRRAVWRTWKAWIGTTGFESGVRRDAYMAARQAAIEEATVS